MSSRTLGLVAILLAAFVDLLGVTIVTVALPSITDDLAASSTQSQAMLSGYSLTFAVGLITGARLGRLLGLRRAFVIGVAGFTMASLACGLAGAAWVLVLARVMQGLFAALMVPQVLAFIQLMYDPSERAKPMAAFSALLGIAAAAGPILGGVLIALDLYGTGWRGVFLVNVPIGVVVVALAWRALPPARARGHIRLDPVGLALSAASLFLVMWGLAGLAATRTPLVEVGVIVLGLALFVVFLAQQRASEHRGGQPLVPLVFQQRSTFRSAVAVQVLFFIPVMGFSLVITQYVQTHLGYSALLAGLVVLPWALLTGVGAGVGTTVLLPRLGRLVIQTGLVTMSLGMALVIAVVLLAPAGPAFWHFLPGSAVGGLGMGLVVGPLTETALSRISREHASEASGVFNSVGQLSASFGFATVGSAYFAISATGTADPLHNYALGIALSVGIAVALLAAVVAVRLPRHHITQANPPMNVEADG
ncbi:MFS transporter [Rhodococcus ruber]|uniref:MFS transporter n=1 Tax=Rhodococcus ruber TaxID=1830 RepID=UPI000C7B0F29|nr:MFS transporter [Rhodococcus ruber]AUM20112.1 MFS transporter [Rhodococcus ruber]MBD8057290.1 MFS transporter [Rhodococcus ruber]MCF8786745.1 MFS transporter [Rhodococcus ruber]MCF8786826.1 MFS transporter [Rhodococcus ruber]